MQNWSASQSPMSPSSGGGSPFAFDPEEEDLFDDAAENVEPPEPKVDVANIRTMLSTYQHMQKQNNSLPSDEQSAEHTAHLAARIAGLEDQLESIKSPKKRRKEIEEWIRTNKIGLEKAKWRRETQQTTIDAATIALAKEEAIVARLEGDMVENLKKLEEVKAEEGPPVIAKKGDAVFDAEFFENNQNIPDQNATPEITEIKSMAARVAELFSKVDASNLFAKSERAGESSEIIIGPVLDANEDVELPEFHFDDDDLDVAPDPPDGKDDGGEVWTAYRSNHKKYKERQKERFEQRKAETQKQKETYNKLSSAAVVRGGKKVVLGGISRLSKR